MPCKSLGFSLLFTVVLVAGCGKDHHTVHAHSQRDLAQTFERGFPVITLSFAGDTMMDWSVKEAINQHGVSYPFEEVATFFREDDYTLINLETAVTNSLEKEEKQYTFKSDPISLAGLKNSGVDMVSLANNHTMDFGTEGLLDTMSHLEESGLRYIGAGRSEKEAYMAVKKTIKGKNSHF
nr:CapA family protein [Bacillus coahuilensis]